MSLIKKKWLVMAYGRYTCTQWRDTIRGILGSAENIVKNDEDDVLITEAIKVYIRNQADDDQKSYIRGLGIVFDPVAPPPPESVFIRDFSTDNETTRSLNKISKELFGKDLILRIAHGCVPKNRQGLYGRSFYIDEGVDVELIRNTGCPGTIISLTKKKK